MGASVHLAGWHRQGSLSAQEESQRPPIEAREVHQFDRINSPLTRLAFGYPRLGLTEASRYLRLGKTGALPRGPEPFEKSAVAGIVSRAHRWHAEPGAQGCIPIRDIPKSDALSFGMSAATTVKPNSLLRLGASRWRPQEPVSSGFARSAGSMSPSARPCVGAASREQGWSAFHYRLQRSKSLQTHLARRF